ncbi:MAG: integrin alpha [Myxococcota bacterium]|nr:integrin alpha [Myxococcota bacterium]
MRPPPLVVLSALCFVSSACNLIYSWQEFGDADADAEADVDADADADADVDVDVDDAAGPVCGNGVVERGEACDGDPPRSCTTPCRSDGTEVCTGCAWICEPPAEECNGRDDDCDTMTDEVGAGFECGDGCCNGGENACSCRDDCPVVPPPPGVPAPLWPPNGAATGSPHAPPAAGTLRPTFFWRPSDGGCGSVAYEIQIDDSCSTPGFGACPFPSPEAAQTGIAAVRFRPPSDLPVSWIRPVGRRYYWRVRGCDSLDRCSSWSHVRYLDVGRAPGDFNGDGWSDLAVGAFAQTGGAPAEGAVFVYDGSAAGVPAVPSATLFNPDSQALGRFGLAVAVAGDVNADGYADLVVGAFMQDAGATDEGNAFVYLGSAAGLPVAPSIRLDCPGNQAGAHFGISAAGAGDLNGDGFADIVVGASAYDSGAEDEGGAFIYHGRSAGVPAVPDVVLDNPANQARAEFGIAVAGAGDLDGDGFADLAVGAHLQDDPAFNEGVVFVYGGAPTGVPAAPSATIGNPADQSAGLFGAAIAGGCDFDGDGYADLAVAAPRQDVPAINEGAVFVFRGGPAGIAALPAVTLDNPADQADAEFGSSVACAGDLALDGYGDLAVGARYQDAPAENEGNAFVYRGTAAGLAPAPDTTLDNPANQAAARFGTSVASPGDLDGDGYPDLAVGAPMQDAPAGDEGNAFVYYTSDSGVPSLPSVTLDNPADQANAGFGFCVGRAW